MLCSSNTGMHCDAGSSTTTCSQNPTCADTSGATQPQPGAQVVCKCGGINCTSGTGFFCNAQSSLCRPHAVPTCARVDGMAATGVPNCACAEHVECSAGEYCYAALSQCSVDGTDFFGFAPTMRYSGKCTDKDCKASHRQEDRSMMARPSGGSQWSRPRGNRG